MDASGLSVPTTLDEYVGNAAKLAADNPKASGLWWPGQDWYNALPFIWENGGEIAVPDGDAWDAQLSSAGSVAGLTQVQEVMQNASRAPKDGNETNPQVGYCDGTALQISSPSCAKLTPASPKWADVEAAGVLQDLFVNIAQGGDVQQLAEQADADIEDILNG